MNKLSALALAAVFGLASLAPIASADAATMKMKKPAAHHMMAMKPDLVCHMVKEKDGKMHKLCHHHHAVKHAAKKVGGGAMKKKAAKKK